MQVGGAANIGYFKSTERSNISINYTPSYAMQFQSLGGRSISHSLSASWNRSLTPRLVLKAEIVGSLADVTQSVFSPAGPAGTPEVSNAAGLMPAGGLSPAVEPSSVLLLYGQRNLFTTLQTSLTDYYSSRLTIRATGTLNRAQNLKGPGLPDSQNGYLIARTTGVAADIGIDYSLSPVTRVSADLTAFRGISNVQDNYANSASVSLTRNLGRNWVAQMRTGIGFVVPVRGLYAAPGGPQYEVTGSIGYKMASHSFLASVKRGFYDTYALGSSDLSISGNWTWMPRRRLWLFEASVADQRFSGTNFRPLTSWQATARLARSLGPKVNVSTEYAYLSGVGFLAGVQPGGGEHMIRVALNWSVRGSGL